MVVVVDCRLGGVVDMVVGDVGGGVEVVGACGGGRGDVVEAGGAGNLVLDEREDIS